VGKARDLPIHDLRVSSLLKFADGFHLTISLQQLFFGYAHGITPDFLIDLAFSCALMSSIAPSDASGATCGARFRYPVHRVSGGEL
jgi:hypothetical protein